MSSGETQPGNKTPPYHVGKVEGSGDPLLSPQNSMPYYVDRIAGEPLSNMKLPLLKAVGEAATWCPPGLGHGLSPGGTYGCQGYTVKVVVMQTLMADPPLVNMAAT